MSDAILYETHSHTPLCKHAEGDPEEYAAVAEVRGLRGLIVTCHNPLPDGLSSSVRMDLDQFDQYVALVDRARDAWRGRVDVRLGLECDYLPGLEPFLEKQAASQPFDYLLGSVHPHIREFQAMFWKDDPRAFQVAYFEQLAEAAELGLFDCLAHPDLVKNQFVDTWSVAAVMDDIRRQLDRIAATGIAMECNTSGLNKLIPEFNPGPEIAREMFKRGIPVVVGSDAHVPGRVADMWLAAYNHLEAAGYTQVCYFLERRRIDVSISEARASLSTCAVNA
jgi:histidinol-phosphatase (PHP family)